MSTQLVPVEATTPSGPDWPWVAIVTVGVIGLLVVLARSLQ